MDKKQYFQLVTAGNTADLTIYGDITSYPVSAGDVSAHNLSAQLADLRDVSQINVYINSYGGEVAEGLAIYHALRRHKAKITTYCDGMACSIASVIFMAGDERIMCNPSFLMIHDAWTMASGNSADFRKAADDLDVITSASVAAYMEHCNLTEDELRAKMKAETWLSHNDAVEMGFATGIEESASADKPAQNAKIRAFELLAQALEDDPDEEDETDEEAPTNDPPSTDEDGEEDPGEDSVEDEDESPENDDSEAEDAPDDDSDEKDEDEENNDPEPAQKWSGFFNALIRE